MCGNPAPPAKDPDPIMEPYVDDFKRELHQYVKVVAGYPQNGYIKEIVKQNKKIIAIAERAVADGVPRSVVKENITRIGNAVRFELYYGSAKDRKYIEWYTYNSKKG